MTRISVGKDGSVAFAGHLWRFVIGTLMLGCMLSTAVHAVETVCATVKIEIKQELTLERQAFDAEMKINNTTDTGVIENVSVDVKVTDENGVPVLVTDNPNDLAAKFFVRLSSKQNILAVDGTGTVNPATTAVINWLIIPAPGSAGTTPLGKKYLIGATLKYRFNGEDAVLNVSPDVITVKPLPLLTLDYFLTQDVLADDPLTAEIEPVEPFTLGVRIKNTGLAVAKNLKIDSAQPKIIENNQGLLINFLLTGSFLNDAPTAKTLLINFGDIAAGSSKMGRWVMETTLAGKFTEFTARFSHADELGGALTSILQATNAHLLLRDVRVDVVGRDAVRDFLARDGDVIRVYESDGADTEVTDRSGVATLSASTVGASGNAVYRLSFPATDGFVYVRLPDPYNGSKALAAVLRSDAKRLLAENVWLSKTRNEQSKQWEYWINVFDVNSTGSYDSEFIAPPLEAQPPVLQFIADQTTRETEQVGFLVEASSPNGKAVTLSAAPLPLGATFTQQPVDPLAPSVARATFDWAPAAGQAGSYLITYTATDGTLSATRSATVVVNTLAPPFGPETPLLDAPPQNAAVPSTQPTLSVYAGTDPRDPTQQIIFEIYADEAMTQLVETATVAKAVSGPTVYVPVAALNDNAHFWWRARAANGASTEPVYSAWMNARFFVNVFNDAPETFNLASPAAGVEVATLQPLLSWANTTDIEGDTITYSVFLYADAAATELVASVADLPVPTPGQVGEWMVPALPTALLNHATYYWRVTATDAWGAQTSTALRAFIVNTGNVAPTEPRITAPQSGSWIGTSEATLVVQNATDADGDLITHVFEIDSVNTFDSGSKQSSGPVVAGAGGSTSWTVSALLEDVVYYWRVKAQDGRAESAWVSASFLVNAQNLPPSIPTLDNPGNQAWVSSQSPGLSVHPAVDAEHDALTYDFEVYRQNTPTVPVASGSSTTVSWLVPVLLDDHVTYEWRARAVDAYGAASAWSARNIMYISTGSYQPPALVFTSPAQHVVPTMAADGRKTIVLAWEGTDPNIEANIALYYSTDNSSFAGTLIADGFRQQAGTHAGSYIWDVSSFAPGAYYIYGVIHDPKGVGKAYAAGALVVPAASPRGSLLVTRADDDDDDDQAGSLTTTEAGGAVSFEVRLGSMPTANVIVPIRSSNPREGKPSVAQLLFSNLPAVYGDDDHDDDDDTNAQTVRVIGQDDCLKDGNQAYYLNIGPVVSLDPHYMGLSAAPIEITNRDDKADAEGNTNMPQITLCAAKQESKTRVKTMKNTWDYVFTFALTNSGGDVSGLRAEIVGSLPVGWTLLDGELTVGAVAQGETVRSTDTVAFRVTSENTNVLRNTVDALQWLVGLP